MSAPLSKDLTPVDIPLKNLFLDPNNPRFVGSDWIYVPDDRAIEEDIQKKTSERLIAHHDVDKLKSVMEYNGYLPIDRVVVRKSKDDTYIVLEGNRRICAAKQITGYSGNGEKITPEIMRTFDIIPCLLYEGEEGAENASWIFQGLRHISGISEWPAFNKAKLLVEQMDTQKLSFTEVGRSFGLSPYGAAQWVRGYYAFQQAKDYTEFGNYIDEQMYPFFQEIFGRSSIALKEWLNWDEEAKNFSNAANFNEFVSWFYPVSKESSDDGIEREPTRAEVMDAWQRRKISKRDDLRSISYLIQKSPKDWLEFRSGTDLEKAYNRAVLAELEKNSDDETTAAEKFFRIIEEADRQLQNAPFSVLSSKEHLTKLLEHLDSIKATSARISQFGQK